MCLRKEFEVHMTREGTDGNPRSHIRALHGFKRAEISVLTDWLRVSSEFSVSCSFEQGLSPHPTLPLTGTPFSSAQVRGDTAPRMGPTALFLRSVTCCILWALKSRLSRHRNKVAQVDQRAGQGRRAAYLGSCLWLCVG
jgi:hypothetical protein